MILDSLALSSMFARSRRRLARRGDRAAASVAIGAPTLVETSMVLCRRTEVSSRRARRAVSRGERRRYRSPSKSVTASVAPRPSSAMARGHRRSIRRLHDYAAVRRAAAARRRRRTSPGRTASRRLDLSVRSRLGAAASVQALRVGLDRVGPAQLLRRLAHPDHPRRDAGDDGVGGDVLGDHRVGADDRVVADPDAAQDAGAVADPDVGADLDVALVDALTGGSAARPRPRRGRSR